jgi:hypothetical protein
MAIHPKTPVDLALAPVAVGIDLNLRHLRGLTPGEIETELAFSLNADTRRGGRAERERWLLEAATRFVNLHHWTASITDDACRLRLQGGSVSVDLGLSAGIVRYLERGASA